MLIYPKYSLRTRKNNDATEVWDIVRKQWIILTPEELVRQHFIHYLIHEKKYPLETIVVEREFQVYHLKKRFDVAVLNKNQDFVLIAECKAPHIELNENVLRQILTYNISLNAQYIVITNGLTQYVCQKKQKEWQNIPDVPLFTQ